MVSVGLYSILQLEITPSTVIAFLTIMGYSLYDTIVVYDKVREVTGRLGATERYTYTELMNLALNRVTMRSLNTSITSAIPIVSLLLIGSVLMGATTLQEFGIALLVGIIVGSYSSLFIASTLVTVLKDAKSDGSRWPARSSSAQVLPRAAAPASSAAKRPPCPTPVQPSVPAPQRAGTAPTRGNDPPGRWRATPPPQEASLSQPATVV